MDKYQHKRKKQDKFRNSILYLHEIAQKDAEEVLHPHYWMKLRLKLQSISLLSLFEFWFILIKYGLNFI